MKVRVLPVVQCADSLSEPWVDHSRKPYVSGALAYIPVREGYSYTDILPERRRKARGYQVIGDLVAFHGTRPEKIEIDEVKARHQPRGVFWYKGHKGDLRIPDIELLDGDLGEVLHKESGIYYLFDVTKVMFSQGNQEEKRRVSGLVRPGEKICDMFAGIGYFTLPMAKAGGYVHAIELNPDSYQYLIQNITTNNLSEFIIPTLGDCAEQISGEYDRICMGHFDAVSYLPIALSCSTTGTVLHLHSIGDVTEEIHRCLSEAGLSAKISCRLIKKIGPCKEHIVSDVVIV